MGRLLLLLRKPGGSGPGGASNALLIESGSYLLLEDGSKLLLES